MRMPLAAFRQKIVCLPQDIPRVFIFFANNIHCVAIEEPTVPTMFTWFNFDFCFVSLCQEQDNRVINSLIANFKEKALIAAEI